MTEMPAHPRPADHRTPTRPHHLMAAYFRCYVCEQTALYDGHQEDHSNIEVVHTACLEADRAERARALRENVAQEIALATVAHCWPSMYGDGPVAVAIRELRDRLMDIASGNPADVAAAYREAHPDIDWDTHVVGLRKTVHGYEAAGHQPVRTATATPGDRG